MAQETSKVILTQSGADVYDIGALSSATKLGQATVKYRKIKAFEMASDPLLNIGAIPIDIYSNGTLIYTMAGRNPSRNRLDKNGNIVTDHYSNIFKTVQFLPVDQKIISRKIDPLVLNTDFGGYNTTLDNGVIGTVISNQLYSEWRSADKGQEKIYKSVKMLNGIQYIGNKYHIYKLYEPVGGSFEAYRKNIYKPLTKIRNIQQNKFNIIRGGIDTDKFQLHHSLDFTYALLSASSTIGTESTVKKIENYEVNMVGKIPTSENIYISHKYDKFNPNDPASVTKYSDGLNFVDADEEFDFTNFDACLVYSDGIAIGFTANYEYEARRVVTGEWISSCSFKAPVSPSEASPDPQGNGVVPAVELVNSSVTLLKLLTETAATPALSHIYNWSLILPKGTNPDTSNAATISAIKTAIQQAEYNREVSNADLAQFSFQKVTLNTNYQNVTITSTKSDVTATDILRIRIAS